MKRILPVDVHQPQPLGAGSGAPLPADALVSTFCLEAVSPDLASFQRALGHVTSLLRPGGHLLLIGALEESWYLAGEARLAVVPLREEDVREALVRDLCTYTMPAHLISTHTVIYSIRSTQAVPPANTVRPGSCYQDEYLCLPSIVDP